MTKKARITQNDLDRAVKAAFRSGAPTARIIARLDHAELEIILSERVIEQGIDNPWENDSAAT